MQKSTLPRRQMSEPPLSLLVFVVLSFFTYGILFKAPYAGFAFGASKGEITDIFIPQKQEPFLQKGDVLVKVGEISWEDFKRNRTLVFFEGVEKGDVVSLDVLRDGVNLTIPWEFPGFNLEEFSGRFFNIWWLAYVFWLMGILTHLSIRPKDERWRLFITANHLTALWLIFGSLSGTHVWGSSLLLRVVTWLLLPVYLHLHWVFPKPLGELPKTAWMSLYVICLFFAAAEIPQFLPGDLYTIPFLAALIGSFLLMVTHYFKQEDRRRDVLLLVISLFVVFIPSVGLGVLTLAQNIPSVGPVALFALPFMPLAYFYVIHRRQLGGLEVRVNRIVSLYGFMILIFTALFLIVVPLSRLDLNPETWIFTGSLLVLLTATTVIVGFPAFQAFVEKRFFGIKLPYQNLQETYSSRITTSASLPSLLQLLEEEVLPSLLVRQFAFLRVLDGELKILFTKNVDVERLSHKCTLDELTAQAGKFFPDGFPCDWVRLILPLKVGDRLIGFWLLGRRDPDDYYPQAEIPILQAIANQTAVALSNIQHAEQLRKMYQTNIERNEKERMSLALELHDNVLNGLAILRTNLDDASLPPRIQTSYEEVTRRLREIVSDLRPPMLMYGLVPAVHALADNLMERSGDRVTIQVDIQEEGERLPQNIERHLFRIVQEACENSLRHARARNILITGILTPRKVELNITDDGVGFDSQTELSSLIANSHFGLAGMVERANLLGAEINIQSEKNSGTMIRVMWTGETGNG